MAILPFIEQEQLYNQFKRDEPWDSEHNKQLLARMPSYFALEGVKIDEPNTTFFQVFVGPGTAFEPTRKPHKVFGLAGQRLPTDFLDGTATTILITEAAEAVPWTKPADLTYDPHGPLPALGGHYVDGFLALMADGTVRFVKKSVSEQTLRNAIMRNDGQVPGSDW